MFLRNVGNRSPQYKAAVRQCHPMLEDHFMLSGAGNSHLFDLLQVWSSLLLAQPGDANPYKTLFILCNDNESLKNLVDLASRKSCLRQ
jgi:hypothetical protein